MLTITFYWIHTYIIYSLHACIFV